MADEADVIDWRELEPDQAPSREEAIEHLAQVMAFVREQHKIFTGLAGGPGDALLFYVGPVQADGLETIRRLVSLHEVAIREHARRQN